MRKASMSQTMRASMTRARDARSAFFLFRSLQTPPQKRAPSLGRAVNEWDTVAATVLSRTLQIVKGVEGLVEGVEMGMAGRDHQGRQLHPERPCVGGPHQWGIGGQHPGFHLGGKGVMVPRLALGFTISLLLAIL